MIYPLLKGVLTIMLILAVISFLESLRNIRFQDLIRGFSSIGFYFIYGLISELRWALLPFVVKVVMIIYILSLLNAVRDTLSNIVRERYYNLILGLLEAFNNHVSMERILNVTGLEFDDLESLIVDLNIQLEDSRIYINREEGLILLQAVK